MAFQTFRARTARSTGRTPPAGLALALALSASLLGVGCAGKNRAQNPADGSTSVALSDVSEADLLARRAGGSPAGDEAGESPATSVEAAAAALEALYREQQAGGSNTPPRAATPGPRPAPPAGTRRPAVDPSASVALETEPLPAPPIDAAVPPPTRAGEWSGAEPLKANAAVESPALPDPARARSSVYAQALAEELSRRAATDADPTAALLALEALALIEPSASNPGPATAAAPGALPPGREAVIEEVRALLESLRPGSPALESPSALASMLSGRLDALASQQQVRIGRVELCRRVDGFGRYDPIADRTFLAGRSHPLIVYVEVEGFSQRPGQAGTSAGTQVERESYTVELGQALELTHVGDRLQVLHRPEQTVRESASRPRRDFYLVQRIDLPPTLQTGSYALKVRVRDLGTGAIDERIVPLSVVADAALARGGRN